MYVQERVYNSGVRVVWSLLRDNEEVGAVVVYHATQKAYCSIDIHGQAACEGSAGGGGYDKASAAFEQAACKAFPEVKVPNIGGTGMNRCEQFLLTLGYRVIRVIG